MKFRKGLILGSCLGVVLLATGCGGITASPSVSPGSFFLPGLMNHETPKHKADPLQPSPELAVLEPSPRS